MDLRLKFMAKFLFKSVLIIVIGGSAYLLVLRFPYPFFSFKTQYKNLVLYSDQGFDEQKAQIVLSNSIERLSSSPFFRKDREYRLFICNNGWRRLLFFRDSQRVGGQSDYPTPSNFLGPVKVEDNVLLKRNGDPAPYPRTLDYFIAHELTHQVSAEAVGLRYLSLPAWIVEGYADFVAQGDKFDFLEKLKEQRLGKSLDIWKTEYDAYNLAVTYLLKYKHVPLEQLFSGNLKLEEVEKELKGL